MTEETVKMDHDQIENQTAEQKRPQDENDTAEQKRPQDENGIGEQKKPQDENGTAEQKKLQDENGTTEQKKLQEKNEAAVSVPKKKAKKSRKAVYIVCGVLLSVLLLIIGGVLGYFYHFYSLIAVREKPDDYSETVSLSDEEMQAIPEGEVVLPEEDVYFTKDVVNILLIGTDERTEKFDKYARADSIMVLSLNKKTNAVKLVSLERGMLVRIPGRPNDILNHTFHYGGAKLVIETVRTHFNLDVDRYVRVNFAVFQQLVNEIGGVDVTLTKEEAKALNEDFRRTDIKEGLNHLDGKVALGYSRLRRIDSDWHRIERQRNVIFSIKEHLEGRSVVELDAIANDCLPYVQTNLTSMELADLLFHLQGYVNGDFKQMTIPKKGTYRGLGDVDFKANSKVLRKFLYDD